MDMARLVVETDECEGNSRIVKEADEIERLTVPCTAKKTSFLDVERGVSRLLQLAG